MYYNSFTKKPLRLAVGALAAAGLSLTVGALTTSNAYAAEQSGLEEIVVTATQRSENQQEVAIPMTAVSGESLERAFAQDLRDLTAAAPNVQLEPVGIYVDGIVQARVSTALSDLLDIRSVEILRGPQGTLFGRNTIAGAVQVLHNDPEYNEWGAEASLQVGNFGRQDIKLVMNLPLVDDTLAARIAIKDTGHDGYWKNAAQDNRDRGATDRLTILPSVKWTPSENLDVVVRGEWNRTRDDTYLSQSDHYCRDDPFTLFTGGGSGAGGRPDNDLVITTQTLFNLIVLGQDPVTAAKGASEICAKPIEDRSVKQEYTAPNFEPRGQKSEADIRGITGQLNYDLPEIGTVTYLGGYRHVKEDIIFGIDASYHDLFAGERIQRHQQSSHELRFASSFSDTVDFVAGAYYFEQEYTMKQESWGLLFAPNVVLGPTLGFSGNVSFTSPVTQGQAGFSNQTNDAWAVYTRANWHVTDDLTLTVGGRYTSETKEFTHCAVGSGNPLKSVSDGTDGCNNVPAFVVNFALPPVPGTPTPLFQLTPAIGVDSSGGRLGGCRPVLDASGGPITCNNQLGAIDETWTEFSPMVGVTYKVTDDAMLYFTYTKGFTAGGFNGRAGSITTLGPFDPEVATNYELGLKSDWLDNRLRVNLTGFLTQVKDFQTAFIRPAPNGGGQETVQSNLGELKTRGAELELNAVPVDGLTVWATASWLKTERKGFCSDPDGPSGTNPLVPPTVGGPFSAGLAVCGPPQRIDNSTGGFVGWLIPNNLDELNPTGRSPKWTYSAGIAYEIGLDSWGSVTAAADWQHQGKQTIAGSRVNELKGVRQFNGDLISHFREASDVVNASLIWRSPESRYQASFFVKNLTNELFAQAVTNVGGLSEIRVPNVRRHWGLEVSARVGN